jgi:hypothetical protein
MVDAVSGSNVARVRIERHQPAQLDALTARRAEECRRLALAAVNQKHRESVARAVSAYMSFTPPAPADTARPAVTLEQAKNAYEQF